MNKGKRQFIFAIVFLFMSVACNLTFISSAKAQFFPGSPFLWLPSCAGSPFLYFGCPYFYPIPTALPLLPGPMIAQMMPLIPLFSHPSPLALLRTSAVLTATSPLVLPAATTIVTITPPAVVVPPSTTPAGFTVTSLIPATAPVPLLPVTTTTYGALTSLVLSGTSPYTVLSFLLL